jgi:hypothetical protein
MLKQWRNEKLGIIYFFIPNSKNNEILTTDGIIIPYDDFKKMTKESYDLKKKTSSVYDYESSRKSERLVKKVITQNKLSQIQSSSNDFIKESKNSIQKPIKTIKHESEIKSVQTNNLNNEKETDSKNVKEKFNLFEWIYPKIMILITIVCSILSVYFTGTYLTRLQNIVLAYSISLSMLLYGLIGFQIARRKHREKNKGQAFIYYITSIVVILFSMLSSIDVNYAKYKINHADEEIAYNTNDGVRMSYNILKQELEDNKEIISNAQKDIEFQQTQWVLAWDNELGKNVLLEGRISATAQEKIKEDNQRIEELTLRNKEINAQLIEYAQSGITMNKEEGNLEKSKSLTDLLGMLLGLSGDLIQLIFLLVPSFFIDVINLMAISIYCDSFENKNF